MKKSTTISKQWTSMKKKKTRNVRIGKKYSNKFAKWEKSSSSKSYNCKRTQQKKEKTLSFKRRRWDLFNNRFKTRWNQWGKQNKRMARCIKVYFSNDQNIFMILAVILRKTLKSTNFIKLGVDLKSLKLWSRVVCDI